MTPDLARNVSRQRPHLPCTVIVEVDQISDLERIIENELGDAAALEIERPFVQELTLKSCVLQNVEVERNRDVAWMT